MSTTTTPDRPVTCPSCGGERQVYVHLHMADGPHRWEWQECRRCEGTGLVPALILNLILSGQAIRECRKRRLMDLRGFAARYGIDHVLLCQIENGRITDEATVSAVERAIGSLV